jgi:hypothetical protein
MTMSKISFIRSKLSSGMTLNRLTLSSAFFQHNDSLSFGIHQNDTFYRMAFVRMTFMSMTLSKMTIGRMASIRPMPTRMILNIMTVSRMTL